MKITGKSVVFMATVVVAGAGTPGARAENATSTRVTVEGVNDYESSGCWGAGSNLPNQIADVDGFRSGMTQPGSSYTLGVRWVDSNVWASDFYDPDRTGNSSDGDSSNFDRGNDAIAYFSGHGTCLTGDTTQDCTSGSNCTSPPAGSTSWAFCRRYPGDSFGYCSYTRYARELAVGNCTSGVPAHMGRVNYSGGLVRWGESSHSGAWAGASQNGGANMVVLHASCAEMSNRGQEIWPAFGGIHLLATTMVHTGDTGMSADRGANFAARYRANPWGSVSQAWADALNASPHRNDWCKNRAGTASYGGGFGFNGCGAQISTALGATSAEAVSHHAENWYDLQSNARDGAGASYWASRWICNYDCNTWTFYI